jgi:hypothetical protein
MKTAMIVAGALMLWCGPLMPCAHAQKGMGEPTGVARQAVKPAILSLSGKLVEIKTGPCEKSMRNSTRTAKDMPHKMSAHCCGASSITSV